MAVLRALAFVLFIFILCGLYYYENVIPFQPQTLLSKLKAKYSLLQGGRISYHHFIMYMEEECSRIMVKDSEEMVRFKRLLLGMLPYKDFITTAFSDPKLTVQKLYASMEQYNPYTNITSVEDDKKVSHQDNKFCEDKNDIPELFTSGLGGDLMTLMIKHRHCEAGSLRWMDELPENTTALQGAFADAICKALKLPFRGRYTYLKQIWGDKNFSEYLNNACNSIDTEREQLQGIIRKVIINYELPAYGEQYRIPKDPLVIAPLQKES